MVQNEEEKIKEGNQLIDTAEQALFVKDKCVEELLKAGNYDLSSSLSQIKDVDINLISKIKSDVLQFFVKVRVRKDLS